MPDTAPNPELLHSLGRLVRGLSALFWGLPAALIVCIGTAVAGWLPFYREAPPAAVTGLLLFGVWQLDSFQKQERPWRNALDRSKIFAVINLGLSPFVFWWNRHPDSRFFDASLAILVVSAWLFLFTLNTVLLRLGAMLPDETLRYETRQFTSLNQMLLGALAVFGGLRIALSQIPQLPKQLGPILALWERGGLLFLALLGLLPLAMTMALIWKTKEVILDSVFGVKKN
jgi:hypothetical protein